MMVCVEAGLQRAYSGLSMGLQKPVKVPFCGLCKNKKVKK